jgi:hypothetical protein
LLLSSSIGEKDFSLVEQSFVDLERNTEIIDQALPFRKLTKKQIAAQLAAKQNGTNYVRPNKRMLYRDFDWYHIIREHYALFPRLMGAYKQYDAKAGELTNTDIRADASLTDHRSMAMQIITRNSLRHTILALTNGTPYLPVDGPCLAEAFTNVEDRLELFVRFAERKLLYLPGKKLTEMMSDFNGTDWDEQQLGVDESQERRIRDAAESVMKVLRPRNATFRRVRGLTCSKKERWKSAGGRDQIFRWNDIYKLFFQLETYRKLIGDLRRITPQQSQEHVEVCKQLQEDIKRCVGCEKVKIFDGPDSMGFFRWTKVHNPFQARLQPGMHVQVVGRNDTPWYAKVLAIFGVANVQDNAVIKELVKKEKLAGRSFMIVQYYSETDLTDNVFGYPIMEPEILGIVSFDTVTSFAHVFQEPTGNICYVTTVTYRQPKSNSILVE